MLNCRDIVDVSLALVKNLKRKQLKKQVEQAAEDEIMDSLTGPQCQKGARDTFREMLRKGDLEQSMVEVNVPVEKSGSQAMPHMQSDSSQGKSASELPGFYTGYFRVLC